jgi:immunity protein 5 of polymorphic toxin system
LIHPSPSPRRFDGRINKITADEKHRESSMKKYNKQDQRSMATWAADCAKRVLPFFEEAFQQDDRPRKAIEACRTWVRTGVFRMADIRGASLAAHAAARDVKENNAACLAARAAGQAVATAHVPQHAFGAAYYALKAVMAADPEHAEANIAKERNWQSRRLPKNLRAEILNKIIVQKSRDRILIKIQKGPDF